MSQPKKNIEKAIALNRIDSTASSDFADFNNCGETDFVL
jgi:hypothetical protein